MKVLSKLYNQNKYFIFGIYTLLIITISWAMRTYLPFEQMMYNNLSEQLSAERIKELTNNQKQWAWLGYAIVPLMLLLKWSLIAIPLYVGAIFFEAKLSFKKAFQTVLVSELVSIIISLVKFAWFWFQKDTLTLEYVQFFMPLSLINFFTIGELDKWFVYPLQSINLFEVAYWFVLALLLSKEIKQPLGKTFEFVVSTYGIALLIWMVFVSFLILNFS